MKTPFSISRPKTDPTALFRARDGIYAADLLVAAVGWLDIFTWLSKTPSDVRADVRGISEALRLAPRPVDVMMTLFAAMGLVADRDGAFVLTDLAKEHLVGDSAHNLGPYFASLRERPTCRQLLEVLKTGKPVGWGSKAEEQGWANAMKRQDFAESFTAAMDSRGAYLAPALAEELDCAGYARLLDVAGGSGIYSRALVEKHADLQAAVLERPPVDDIVRSWVRKRNLSDRISVVAGDMFTGIPDGYDIHLYAHVLHDWDEKEVKTLIGRSFESLSPGGLIAIYDAHLDADKAGPLPVAEYSVLLMCSTEGKCYAVSELTAYLEQAGFRGVTYRPTVAFRSLITAKKPNKAIQG